MIRNKEFNLSYKDYVLDNGIKLRFVLKKGFKTKSVAIGVKYGSIDTHFIYDGKEYNLPSGVAHAIEHRIYELPDGSDAFYKLSKLCDANAWTSLEQTNYVFSTSKDILEPLNISLDFIFSNTFNESALKMEKKIIKSEALMAIDNLYAKGEIDLLKKLYKNTSLCYPVAGVVRDINSLTINDLMISYKAFYRPENIYITITGDLDIEPIFKFMNNYFKNIVFDEKVVTRLNDYNSNNVIKRITPIKDKTSKISKVMIGFRLEPLNEIETLAMWGILYILFSSKNNIIKILEDSEIIDYGCNYGMTYSTDFMYITIDANSQEPKTAISELIKSIKYFDELLINDETILSFKRHHMGEILPIANNIEALTEEINENLIIGHDILKLYYNLEHLNKNEILNALYLLKKAQFSANYIKSNKK